MDESRSVRATILQALDDEEALTLRTLRQIPADRWDWRPHAKSTPLGRLAGHVATLPDFAVWVMTTDVFDLASPPGGGGPLTPFPGRAADLVTTALRACQGAREALANATEDDLWATWRLVQKGNPVVGAAPRHVMLQRLFFNHLAHHRAQIGVYLRLCEVPVPSIYGPSADDSWEGQAAGSAAGTGLPATVWRQGADEATRHLLRHLVATIAFRTRVCLRDAPDGFADFRAGADVRTPIRLIRHMYWLMTFAGRLLGGGPSERITLLAWQQEVDRLRDGMAALDRRLATDPLLPAHVDRALQGPIADALTHVGQLGTLRRLAGSPIAGARYPRARIREGEIHL